MPQMILASMETSSAAITATKKRQSKERKKKPRWWPRNIILKNELGKKKEKEENSTAFRVNVIVCVFLCFSKLMFSVDIFFFWIRFLTEDPVGIYINEDDLRTLGFLLQRRGFSFLDEKIPQMDYAQLVYVSSTLTDEEEF